MKFRFFRLLCLVLVKLKLISEFQRANAEIGVLAHLNDLKIKEVEL